MKMMDLFTVVWDFDPTLVSIGSFEIRYYGVLWAVALLFGAWLFAWFCRKEGKPQELADSAFLYIALGTIIGARVGHCLFYEPEYYLLKPWAIVTEIRDGGMASHGATIGILLGIWLCSRKNRVSPLWMTDRLVIIAAICGSFIRVGNLLNSEIVGSVTDVPWGFKFMRLYPHLPVDMVPVQHPTQIYEAICYVLTFVLLMCLYKYTQAPKRRGLLFGVGLLGIFLTRFIIEFVKVEQVDFEKGMLLDMGQLLSIPFVLWGFGMIYYAMKRPPVEDEPVAEGKPLRAERRAEKKNIKNRKR